MFVRIYRNRNRSWMIARTIVSTDVIGPEMITAKMLCPSP